MSVTATEETLLKSLRQFADPILGADLLEAGLPVEVSARGGTWVVDIELGFPAKAYGQTMAAGIRAHLKAQLDVEAEVNVGWRVRSAEINEKLQPVAGVKNMIAVASGKGGVGKSTVAANLALALHAEGARVGMLDADIYGPSQPRMLGTDSKPTSPDGKIMIPVEALGLQCMSMGFLIGEDQPMIWRGPMATQALSQLIGETRWDDLDYLIVDMPPGTGDIQLTLSQRVPVSGAVVVTTPQDIALIDARKGLQMFRRVEVPILGLIENMSFFVCPKCSHPSEIFGTGGGDRMAAEYKVELLGKLPLDARIREQADGGKPTVAADPDSETSGLYRGIALRMAARLAHGSEGGAFPEIVMTDD